MKLIICEKPTLAGNCKRALEQYYNESFITQKGYYEGKNYIVTFCIGHLLTLYDVDDYEGSKVPWSLDNIPYIPDSFKLKFGVDKSGESLEKQYKVIEKLLARTDVEEVINFGDADREGECIVRNVVYRACGNNFKMKRIIFFMLIKQKAKYCSVCLGSNCPRALTVLTLILLYTKVGIFQGKRNSFLIWFKIWLQVLIVLMMPVRLQGEKESCLLQSK